MSYRYKEFYRRKLPHIHPPGATLFVTFRLAGSIPRSVVEHWRAEKFWLDDQIKRAAKSGNDEVSIDLLAFQRRWFQRFEGCAGSGSVRPNVAEGRTDCRDCSRQPETSRWWGLSSRRLLKSYVCKTLAQVAAEHSVMRRLIHASRRGPRVLNT